MPKRENTTQEYSTTMLDRLYRQMKRAEEEYNQWLQEYEDQYGESAREAYEDTHVTDQ